MASVSIRPRKTKSGSRFQVRYRLGGRGYPLVHGGSFPTLKEARLRRALVAGELAAGRNPAEVLQALVEAPQRRTFADWAADYRASRVDAGEGTLRNLGIHVKLLSETFGASDPHRITVAEVTAWIAAAPLKPSSLRVYFVTLRAILDFAGVTPNPCRDQRVKLPRQAHEEINPPSADEVEAIIGAVPSRWRLPLRVLEPDRPGDGRGRRHDAGRMVRGRVSAPRPRPLRHERPVPAHARLLQRLPRAARGLAGRERPLGGGQGAGARGDTPGVRAERPAARVTDRRAERERPGLTQATRVRRLASSTTWATTEESGFPHGW